MTDLPALTDAERAYFAAVVDTKGRIDFIRQKKRGKVYVSAALSFEGLKAGVRAWIAERFPAVRAKKRSKGGVLLYLLGLEASAAFVAVKPWLSEMKAQAEGFVRFAAEREVAERVVVDLKRRKRAV